ncbi:unnamed protein product [Lactuca saligna]|uniref:Uncharacterized protein n=1 Tax=Lactuca saligna TaxID=75948 RepID=A0AA35VIV8_LACSI|nr:unnamed protein product [Lactuca saligna]
MNPRQQRNGSVIAGGGESEHQLRFGGFRSLVPCSSQAKKGTEGGIGDYRSRGRTSLRERLRRSNGPKKREGTKQRGCTPSPMMRFEGGKGGEKVSSVSVGAARASQAVPGCFSFESGSTCEGEEDIWPDAAMQAETTTSVRVLAVVLDRKEERSCRGLRWV